jgi:hypothetical protein
MPGAPIGPFRKSLSMLRLTPPYVTQWPPAYWCRRRPAQCESGTTRSPVVDATPFHRAIHSASGPMKVLDP